jgi:hypothetical protein
LNSHGVEYVVVGGHAVGYHGYPRYTGDIDFFVRSSPENASRVVKVLVEFGFEDANRLESDLVEADKIVQLGRPPNRIDLMTGISGVEFTEAWESAETTEMEGLAIKIIGRDALLRNKRSSGRTKDLADAEEIEGAES